MPEPLTYYLAGDLFDLKDLTGNALLAEAVWSASDSRYKAILPQDLEANKVRNVSIRDADLLALLKSDLALFHFDGTDLDSGTVVEFMVAKAADIPSVILRTDFRRAGDNDDVPWNLMCGDYPRTEKVLIHAMALYHKSKMPGLSIIQASERAIAETAGQVVAAFDKVRAQPSVLPVEMRDLVYKWLALFPGFGSDQMPLLADLLKSKVGKGLL